MNKLIITALFFISAMVAKAQPGLYLRAEMNQSNVKNSDTRIQKGTGAINLGGGLEALVPIVKVKKGNFLALKPYLTYLPTGYQTVNSTYKVKVNYISAALPINYVYHIALFGDRTEDDLMFYLGAGPFLNYAVSGKFKLTAIDDYKKMSFGNGTTDNRKSTDEGVLINTGMKSNKFLVGIQYNIGLANEIPKDRISNGSSIKTKTFLLSVSYRIGGKVRGNK